MKTKNSLIKRILTVLVLLIFVNGCKKDDAPQPVTTTPAPTTNTGTGGSGGGSFDLSTVADFTIESINLISFDFALVTSEPDLEFYADIWDGNTWFYLGVADNCVANQTEQVDLPVDLICTMPDVLNAQFYNNIEIEILDEDQNSPDDSYGSVYFVPANHITSSTGTKTITLSNTAGIGYTVEVEISW